MTDLRWGILGGAAIARHEVGPAIASSPRSQLTAVATRNLTRSTALASELGAPTAYGSYRELIEDPTIDVIYVATPNALHYEWALAALSAGKHVLCEKPLGMTATEVASMAEAAVAAGRVLLEGFMWRHHPRIARVQELLAAGVIGELRLVSARYGVRSRGLDDPTIAAATFRYTPDLGGGALADLGCYCIDGIQLFVDATPKLVRGTANFIHGVAVETTVSGQLDFGDGTIGQFFATMDSATGSEIELVGTTGRIRIPKAFRIRPADNPLSLEIQTVDGASIESFPFADQYRLEVEHLERIVLDGESPAIPLHQSLRTATTVDLVREGWLP